MLQFILRRLALAALTVFGVMVLTFVLFRAVAGDIAAAHLGQQASQQQRAEWMHRHGYDKPLLVNHHQQILIADLTAVDPDARFPFRIRDVGGGDLANRLGLLVPSHTDRERLIGRNELPAEADVFVGRYVAGLSAETPLWEVAPEPPHLPRAPVNVQDAEPAADEPPGEPAADEPSDAPADAAAPPEPLAEDAQADVPDAADAATPPQPGLHMVLSDGATEFVVDIAGLDTVGDLLERIRTHPQNRQADGTPRVVAMISRWTPLEAINSQFFHHLATSATFQARSMRNDEPLTRIIAERGPRSLALTVPAMAIGWVAAMVISVVVAYNRGRLTDKLGVFLSVLGMCVPFLAFIIYGQWLVSQFWPAHAFGLRYRVNVYVPVLIMVVAGLGASVRFYRTVILDETNRDYVRTARAKGLPLRNVMFQHILKNAMLPILTQLIMSIPFLIMGSLLVEQTFGIPGLGDLLLSSITDRDEAIISGLVYLTALVYTLALLVTDISYALFDPRVRLR